MQKPIFLFIGLLIVTLAGCVYRMDIPQGNRIEQSSLDKLEIGMTREQVIFLLGDAAIKDQYHANQAHYVYYLFRGEDRVSELRSMVLTYDNNILVDIKGSLTPD